MSPAAEVKIRQHFPMERRAELWKWLNTPGQPNFDDFGPSRDGFYVQLTVRIAREMTWGIWAGGELVGYLGFAPQTPMCGQFHGLVIAPRYRHRGIGSKAVRLAITQLEHEGFEKFIVWTFADNETVMRLFKRLGFELEGYITRATRRGEKLLDMRVLCLPGKEISCHSVDC